MVAGCERNNFTDLYKEILEEGYYTNNTRLGLSIWLSLDTIKENINWVVEKGFLQRKKEKLKNCFRCKSNNTAVVYLNGMYIAMCHDCNIMTKKCITAEDATINWNTKY